MNNGERPPLKFVLQEDVGLYVVDGILEEIRLGMEV